MSSSNDAMTKLCEAMLENFGAGDDFEFELGVLVGTYRAKHERLMRDMQAANLLPLGRTVAAQRLGVAESTVYKMAHRWLDNLSTGKAAA